MTLGEYILNYRKKINITQLSLAKKSGLARSYIARLERGDFEDGSMSLAIFIKLAKALEVPLYKLFKDIKFDSNGNLPPLGVYFQRARRNKLGNK